MSAVKPIAALARAGRIEPCRVGVRVAQGFPPSGSSAPPTDDLFARSDVTSGIQRVGEFEIQLDRIEHEHAATVCWSVSNTGSREVHIESVIVGVRWTGCHDGQQLRFLRHGWQSWSFTGMRALDSSGEPPFPSGEWLRGIHHAVGAPPADRDGWHESDIVTVIGHGARQPVCLAGVFERGEGFGSVYLKREPDGVAIEVELRVEVPLAPGESRALDSVQFALGRDASALLEAFAERWGRTVGARKSERFQAGWCTWYQFFHQVTEADLLRNLDALVARPGEFPIEVVQLDDGYQREIGDWLDTNDRFPRGLEPIARDIRAAGFRPGIWTAPFCVVPESQLYRDHHDWLMRDGDGVFRALGHPVWTKGVWVHALDPSQQAVLDHLRDLYRTLVAIGFSYLKLDFLHAASQRADGRDPRVSRAQRLRRGLRAIRDGAGDDAFLLGCGCPLGPAVGVVDAMRIGPDVAPSWQVDEPLVIPGLEPTLPSTRSAVRSIVHRAWMHRRLWLNDPDCLMARSRDTKLTAEQIRTLAAHIAVTGGMAVFSDDIDVMSDDDRARVREVVALSREVDSMGTRGAARAVGWFDDAGPCAIVARGARDAQVALLNHGDAPAVRGVALADVGLSPEPPSGVLGSRALAYAGDDRIDAALLGHESALYRIPGGARLAVFCDFDGTFITSDIGSTLARTYGADRIPAARQRYMRGDCTAWAFITAILHGLELAEDELDRFLATIELDPGARALVEWCAARDVPFRILSDGFDLIIERLRRRFGVEFVFEANRLCYRDQVWQIEAGHPDDECFCGTGTCKRSRIEAWRSAHPEKFCVHVGNGRISDLCGALAADLVFAKDSLARALDARGVAYEPFVTLRDVIAVLDR